MTTLTQLLKSSLNASILDPEEGSPFQAFSKDGHPRALVVVGPNASGKSLVHQILALNAKKADVANISISIRERTGAGSSDMGGMRKVMMFGDESHQSTGATSVSVVRRGFSNVDSRIQEGRSVVLLLDEPEMGLSDDYASALGHYMAAQVLAWNDPKQVGLVVVSHSRTLIAAFQEGLGCRPMFVSMDNDLTLDEWLAAKTTRTPEELWALEKRGNEGFRFVSGMTSTARKQDEREKASADEPESVKPSRPKRSRSKSNP